jgi:DNA ligase-1
LEAGAIEPPKGILEKERGSNGCNERDQSGGLSKGPVGNALKQVSITLFRPVRLMMAEMAYDVSEALNKHESRTAFEFKFDGARIQIHKKGLEVKVFSRRLTDITDSVPDIAETAKRVINADEVW